MEAGWSSEYGKILWVELKSGLRFKQYKEKVLKEARDDDESMGDGDERRRIVSRRLC